MDIKIDQTPINRSNSRGEEAMKSAKKTCKKCGDIFDPVEDAREAHQWGEDTCPEYPDCRDYLETLGVSR